MAKDQQLKPDIHLGNKDTSALKSSLRGKLDDLHRPGPISVVNRTFYIDVGQVPTTQIPEYMKKVRESLLTNDKESFVEKSKAIGVWEDFFIPVKGNLPARSNLWQRFKEFFVGSPAQVLSATRIELQKIDVEF